MGRGRPSKLTPEVQAKLCMAVSLGLTRELQAGFAGITKRCLELWLKKGRTTTKGPHHDLVAALWVAEGEGAVENMKLIQQAAKAGKWQASAWIMERRHGYRVGGTAEAGRERDIEDITSLDVAQSLQRQIADVRGANQQALQSGSFQAYMAGQRLLRGLLDELRLHSAAGDEDNLADLDSPAFALEMEKAMEDWPDQLLEVAIRVYERRHGRTLLGVIQGGRE